MARDLLNAMKLVTDSYLYGSDLGVNGPRHGRPDIYEREESIEERKMVGPAGAAHGQNGGVDEIADFRRKLENGVVEFEFTKADGSRRHAIGTTSEQIIPTAMRRSLDADYDSNLESYNRRQAFIIWFWDLEKDAVRCFNTNRFEGIVRYEPTSRRFTPNMERIGNIFINRDIDADQEAQPLTQQRVDDLNQRLRTDLNDTGSYSGIAAVITQGIGVNPAEIPDISIERQPNGDPLLRLVIRKNGANIDNGEYRLNLQQFREYILERYGVDVKKIVVDGEFVFE